MNRQNDRSTTVDTWVGSLRIEQKYGARVGDLRIATVTARRVVTDVDGDHVQLSLTIEKRGEKRTTRWDADLILRPEEAAALATALTKLHPKPDPIAYRHDLGTADDRAFYGLPATE